MKKKFDFSGYATKNDLTCSDGLVIRHDAFKDNDGETVPLVWQHYHDSPANVLGHALLENRDDGVYVYGVFNDTDMGTQSKSLVQHGDITALSIHANQLQKRGAEVLHGCIREVSLVLAGANPGASIEYPVLAHSGEEIHDEVVIFSGELLHSDGTQESEGDGNMKKTMKEVYATLTPEQLTVVNFLIGSALDENPEIEHSADDDDDDDDEDDEDDEDEEDDEDDEDEEDDDDTIEHSEGGRKMRKNVFDQGLLGKGATGTELTHDAMAEIIGDAIESKGTFKTAMLEHGITDIDILFPDAQAAYNEPTFYKPNGWIASILNDVHKSPFSRVKTVVADLTEDTARAKGYITGTEKIDEIFGLMTRAVSPQTIYKKQSLERDDIIDITDFDVVMWMKKEMRAMLDEEIARAILIGDGRTISAPDKIKEANIIPIANDANLYSIPVSVKVPTGFQFSEDESEDATVCKSIIKSILLARSQYKGSGTPTMYVGSTLLANMLLLEDNMGRTLYDTEAALATKLRVAKIVEIPDMDVKDLSTDEANGRCAAIIVNLKDYTIGADKGGQVTNFDDFDINFNKYQYLIETRISGALTAPKSSMIVRLVSTIA